MAYVILGLGSNIGNREEYLAQAIAALGRGGTIKEPACSPVYESAAVLKEDAPEEWNIPFLNMAIGGETHLEPEALLDVVKQIESEIGRQERGVWAPREIDIDILAYDDVVITSEKLTIPHALLLERAFALCPLANLAPSWCYPVPGDHHGQTASALVQQLPGQSLGETKTTSIQISRYLLKFLEAA